MANKIVQDSSLTAVADAIRTKSGTSEQLEFPNGFVSAIENMPSGGGGVYNILCGEVDVEWARIDYLGANNAISTVRNSGYVSTPTFSVTLDDIIQAYNDGKVLRLFLAYRDSDGTLVSDDDHFFINTRAYISESEIHLDFKRSDMWTLAGETQESIMHIIDTISLNKYEWSEAPEVFVESVAIAHVMDLVVPTTS